VTAQPGLPDPAVELEAWRARRYAALRQPIGWLTLAGLSWLGEGLNRIGTDARNRVRLPAGPPHAGTLHVRGRDVRATSAPGGFTHGGLPVEGLALVADVDAPDGEPTMLELGTLRMCIIRRGPGGGRLGVRTWDTHSPARTAFAGIDHWPFDPGWVVRATFEPAADGARIGVPDVLGEVVEEYLAGQIAFERVGRSHRLRVLRGGPAGELWLVVADATNGLETCAGGRFVYSEVPDGAGPEGVRTVTVDFNRAYNPPCLFSPHATCPLPPPGNRLELRVEAGEKLYRSPDLERGARVD